MSGDTAPVELNEADAAALRADLAPWTVDAVSELVGDRATRALGREQLVPARLAARAAGNEPIALLTRLMALGETLTRADVARAFPTLGADGAARCGLLAVGGQGDDDAARASVDLRPYAAASGDDETTWWVASDTGEAVTSRQLLDDHVLGIGGATTTLASATMRTPVGRVLDLGTGSGIQALHASQHAREVVATDISQRALAFAAFNRALNAPPAAWDLRLGSLLDPVRGERFDLVVSNPPFVITPAGAPSFEYRDGGVVGDGIVRRLVTDVGSVLAPGGIAQMLGNWEIRTGEGWRDRIEGWLDDAAAAGWPLDAWVIQRDVLDAAEYAETWLRDGGMIPERGKEAFEAAYEAYLTDFDARGIEGIGFGLVTVRLASGAPTLRRLEEHEGELPVPLGPHLAASLAAHDWLAARDDAAVLDARYEVAGDVTRETYGRPLQYEPEHILLRQGGSFGRSIKADTALAGFVGACDGELSAGQIAHALSALLDVPSGVMVEGIVAAVRELVVDGFLVVADAGVS